MTHKYIMIALGLMGLGLAACTPADVQYCRSFGVEGTNEYGKCMNYYHQQQDAFSADRSFCEFEADGTYPPSLYDTGRYERVMGGFGPRGEFYGGQTVRISPDYYHNAQVDNLRMRIIAPCMEAKGWNSPNSWQSGRHAVTPAKKKPATSQKLPWQK